MSDRRPVLHTERLELRPLTEEHLELLVELDSDPEVMRHITGRAGTRPEVEAQFPRRTDPAHAAQGLGFWAALPRDLDNFLGWFALKPPHKSVYAEGALELGYRLRRAAWGRGYATEGGRALLSYGFDTLGQEVVGADAMVVNTGSTHVMDKLGMRLVTVWHGDWPEPLPGADRGDAYYEINRREWAASAWDREAAGFDDEPDHGLRDSATRAAWRKLLLDALPSAPATVADLGCGTGTLSLLLAEHGYDVTGIDVSPEMVARATAKAGHTSARFQLGDAAVPDLPPASFDVVLSRHVLWAMPDPAAALRRWTALLESGGVLVLVEGRWSTGAGLSSAEAQALVRDTGRSCVVRPLTEPAYWGGPITDDRYLLLSPPPEEE